MFRSEQAKMRLYKANLKKEAVNNFKQGEALDEYLLYEKGIESQKSGLSKFASAIGEAVGENLGAREVKPVDKIKQWAAQTTKDTGEWTTQTASNPALDANIVARSKKMPKSIKQPAGPKPVVSTEAIPDLMSFDDDQIGDLTVKQDLKLRNLYMTVLSDMQKSIEVSKREKEFARNLMKVLENHRLDETLSQFKNSPMYTALAEKAFKNLKQLTANAKTNRIVAENAEMKRQKQREATAKSRAKWKGKIKLK